MFYHERCEALRGAGVVPKSIPSGGVKTVIFMLHVGNLLRVDTPVKELFSSVDRGAEDFPADEDKEG